MKTVWFKNTKTEVEREDLKRGLLNNSYLQLLKELLEDELRDLDRKETNPVDYSQASWSHLQAHRNGYRQHLMQTLHLLEFETQERPIQ